MSDEHPAIVICRKDLETYQKLLRDLQSGAFKLGDSVDGVTWRDTTAEQITSIRAKIDELTAILEASGNS